VKRGLVALVGIAAIAAAGCSSVSTTFDYDTDEDFSRLQTFAWMPNQTDASGDAQQAQLQNSLFAKRLKNAVNTQLEAKGYSIDTTDPDFVIVYHTGVQDKVNVTNWGYTYGPYWGPWGESVDVNQYTEGTLILDFIAYSDRTLIWRGTAQKALSGRPDPEKAEVEINKIVAELLANFPPQ
jgi:CRISPR/Cas system-associated endoribonuclease Cas2